MKNLRVVVAVSVVSAVMFGVASVHGGTDPTEDILAAVRGWADAMEAGDAAGVLAFYSEDWSEEGATKNDLRKYFEGDLPGGPSRTRNSSWTTPRLSWMEIRRPCYPSSSGRVERL